MIPSDSTTAAGTSCGPLNGGERHEVCPVREVGLDGARGLEREPRLAHTAGTGKGQQPS